MLDSISYDDKSGFEFRVIKRYSNRKLYDTRSSRYVTLPQIAQMVRAGEDVQIIDNRTKEDKTEVTLALIISEQLKNSPGGIPLGTLRALIRHDSSPPPSGPVSSAGLDGESALGAPLSAALQFLQEDDAMNPANRDLVDSNHNAELPRDAEFRLEQWRAALEEKVRRLPDPQALQTLQGQVQSLHERLAELERRLVSKAE